jgi:hypothetical protein
MQSTFFREKLWYRLLSDHCFKDQSIEWVKTGTGDYVVTTSPPRSAKPWANLVRQWSSATNFYSLDYGCVVGTNKPSKCRSLAEAATSKRVDRVTLDFLEDKCATQLKLEFDASGFYTTLLPKATHWWLPIETSYSEYFAMRSSRVQNTVRRAVKKLEHDFKVEIEVVTAPGVGLDRAIAAYEEVYADSWKSRELYPIFLPDLIRLCADQDKLALSVLRLNDRPVASQFWIVDNAYAYIYKLAYLNEFAKLSVGTVLTNHMFRWAFDRVKVIDYGVGNEGYKRDWMTESRTSTRLSAINLRTAKGKLLALFKQLQSWQKGIGRDGKTHTQISER